jgi:D-alanyl-D-alanine dipeptidase
VISLVLALSVAASPPGLVDVAQAVPNAALELRYATEHNFLHRAVYAHARCLLRADVAASLARAEARLEKQGYRLKLWDCYRPLSVQRDMWKLVPVRGLVADPNKGGSHHNRGTAVDASLVDLQGHDIAMPSDHDDFTAKGKRDAPCADPAAAKHRAALRAAMEAEGFTTIRTEWWHFDAAGADHAPLLDEPL